MITKVPVWKPSKSYVKVPVGLPECPGCGHPLVKKMIIEVIDEMGIDDRVVGVKGVGCGGGIIPTINIDWLFTAHGRPCDVATAIKRVSKGELIVFTYQGDGDCWAIGMESTMHAAIRGERITVIMVNNGNYGTTGGQMAPTTLIGQRTTTTPFGRDARRDGYPFNASELLAHIKGVAYSARGSVHSPAAFQRTKKFIKTAFQKQIDDVGFSYVEVLSPCPPDWRLSPVDCLKRIEEVVIPQYPLGEFKNVERID